MKTALITGASSGLGKEFVRQLADDPAIAQFWVIARRKERLLELQKFTSKPVIAIPLDLCDPHSFDILAEKLQAEKPDITVLVAAAGLGSIGKTEELSVAETNRMIDLNCRAAAAVTRLCLPYMHKGARILEIASIAAFQPMPGFNDSTMNCCQDISKSHVSAHIGSKIPNSSPKPEQPETVFATPRWHPSPKALSACHLPHPRQTCGYAHQASSQQPSAL